MLRIKVSPNVSNVVFWAFLVRTFLNPKRSYIGRSRQMKDIHLKSEAALSYAKRHGPPDCALDPLGMGVEDGNCNIGHVCRS